MSIRKIVMFKRILCFTVLINFIIIATIIAYRINFSNRCNENLESNLSNIFIADSSLINNNDISDEFIVTRSMKGRKIHKYDESKFVEINIPEMKLRLYKRDKNNNYLIEKMYYVAVGRKSKRSPVGVGYIYTKGTVYFKYKHGKKAGSIVSNASISPYSRVKKPIDYSKIKGLFLDINNSRNYVIHSTTEYWSIGAAVSSGCIRMRINDMLELYPLIPSGIKVFIKYDTVKIEEDKFSIYPDYYGLDKNNINEILRAFRIKGWDVGKLNFRKINAIANRVVSKRIAEENISINSIMVENGVGRSIDFFSEMIMNDKIVIQY